MLDKRVLVIEDEFLVALDIKSHLKNAGFSLVEHAATEKAALKQVGEGEWDAAVVDANLNGKSIERVAAALSNKHIPFLIVTGYNGDSLPPEVLLRPVLSKPVQGEELLKELYSLIS